MASPVEYHSSVSLVLAFYTILLVGPSNSTSENIGSENNPEQEIISMPICAH